MLFEVLATCLLCTWNLVKDKQLKSPKPGAALFYYTLSCCIQFPPPSALIIFQRNKIWLWEILPLFDKYRRATDGQKRNYPTMSEAKSGRPDARQPASQQLLLLIWKLMWVGVIMQTCCKTHFEHV